MRAQSFLETITGNFRRSTLTVEGDLVLDGSISAFGASNCKDREFIVELKNTGSVTGSGSLFLAGVKYYGGSKTSTLNFAGSSNCVDLQGSGNLNIVANGQTDVYYNDGMSISSVTANSSVSFYVKRDTSGTKDVAAERLDIQNSLTGSYSVGSGYIRVDGHHANESFSDTGRNEDGTIRTQVTQEGEADYDDFCTENYTGYYREPDTSSIYRDIPYCKNGSTGGYTRWVDKYAINTDIFNEPADAFTYANLQSQVGQYELFEVFLYDPTTKCVTLRLVQSGKTEWTSSDNVDQVFLVRGVDAFFTAIVEYPMGTGVNSGTSTTGSGVLGGENAGSLTGGNASGILSGGRDTQTGGQNDTLTGTNTGATGSGVLGGGSALAGGNAIGVLGGNRQPPAPPTIPATPQGANQAATTNQEVSEYDLVLKVTGSGTQYDLKAFYDGIELKELGGGTVKVELEVQLNPGWDPQDVFAVFRDAQGKLVAVRARYDQRTGKLTFDAPMLGQFRLVYLDWDGTDYTDEAFLAAIAACLN